MTPPPDARPPTVLTVGHSDHPVTTFLALLEQAGVALVADVRSRPWSRHHPQFRRGALERTLSEAGIGYRWLGDALGGRPDDPSLRDAAGRPDHDAMARTAAFRTGIDRCLRLARRRLTAVLCAEADPAGCHRRRLVTPALRERGAHVRHLLRDGTVVGDDGLAAGEQLDLL